MDNSQVIEGGQSFVAAIAGVFGHWLSRGGMSGACLRGHILRATAPAGVPLRILALAILLAWGTASQAAGPIGFTYKFEGEFSPVQKRAAIETIEGGWKKAQALTGLPQAQFVEAEGKTNVVVRMEPYLNHLATTFFKPNYKIGCGQVYMYYPRFRGLGRGEGSRILAHEFLHLMFRLPDEYVAGATLKPGCIMGGLYGGDGLCEGCEGIVRDVIQNPEKRAW